MILVLCIPVAYAAGLAPSTKADPAETRCDPSLPLDVELTPVGQPQVGRNLRFLVSVRSDVDPDLVQAARVEYEIPRGPAKTPDFLETREIARLRNRIRREFGFHIPDASRREIRARFVVKLTNGRTIAQTADCWIDPGEPDLPEGMIGRIVDADGTGIRIYQGEPAKERE